MTKEQINTIAYWRESAERDWATAERLFKLKEYVWSLFLCHLTIEKLLKAVLINKNQRPKFTHDLNELARQSGITVPSNFLEWLKTISRFNIEARYDEYKRSLHNIATLKFTTTWHERSAEVVQWLKQQLN